MYTLLLIVPLGLNKKIYPWGIELIRQYILKFSPDTKIFVWNLNTDSEIQMIYKNHYKLIFKIFDLLKIPKYNDRYYALTSIDLFHLVASFGESFLSNKTIAEQIGILDESTISGIIKLNTIFSSYIKYKINTFINPKLKSLIGFSVYNSTLFNTILTAKVIKRINDKIPIIIGGHSLNNCSAKECLNKLECVDGAVVGYGEKIILELLKKLNQGTPIEYINIPGFLNKANANFNPFSINEYTIPHLYQDMCEQAQLSAVQQNYNGDEATIHVLTQRGCGWGHCTFCADMDKRNKFILSPKRIRDDLNTKIKKLLSQESYFTHEFFKKTNYSNSNIQKKARKQIYLSIDSECNDPEALESIFNCLIEFKNQDCLFGISFWIRIAQINKAFLRMLSFLKDANISYWLETGIESLNPTTLKDMKKGTSPLMILEKIKAVQDSGGLCHGNYWGFFPTETMDSVVEEVYFLSRSLHLFERPIDHVTIIPGFCAGDQNEIFQEQDKFGISIHKTNHFWLKKLFNLDLPWDNLYGLPYSLKRSASINNFLVKTYFNTIFGLFNIQSFIVPRKNHDNVLGLLACLIKTVLIKKPKLLFYSLTLLILLILRRNRAYIDRLIILINGSFKKNSHYKFPKFYIKDGVLVKDYPLPTKNRWVMTLNAKELEILRYLYWHKPYSKLTKKFANQYSSKELNQILLKHLRIGSIIKHGNRYMSIFHDPEYLSLDLSKPN